jgi:hypothetical protein
MNLFESIQKVVEVGKKIKVSVPASHSIVLTNKTDGTAILYSKFSTKVGYPLLSGESLEIEKVPETSTFYLQLKDAEITEDQGFYIVAQPYFKTEQPERNNTVVINN